MRKLTDDVYVLEVNGRAALISGDRLILIDTGTKPENLFKELVTTGYKAKDIENIIITHTHPDHVGGLHALKLKTDAKVAAHELEAKYISKEETYQGPPGPQYQGHPGTPIDDLLNDGQIYLGYEILHTPGHTPGHISLLDRGAGILFAGDAFRRDEGAPLSPMPDMYNFNHKQHRESIKKLQKLNFEMIHMAHGHPVHEHGSKLVNEIEL